MDEINGRVVAAAQRCGADVHVWRAVHQLHMDRVPAAVRHITQGVIEGPITGISDEGFTVAGYGQVSWQAALEAGPFNQIQRHEEGS